MDKYSVQIEAWAPFGEGRGNMFQNPVLNEIGKKYGKSAAQVILRWHLQRGVVVIPKSTHIERMQENLNVFDFALSAEDMARIAALDTKVSASFPTMTRLRWNGLQIWWKNTKRTMTVQKKKRNW